MTKRLLFPVVVTLALLALSSPRPATAAESLPADLEAAISAQLKKAEGKRGKAGCVVIDLETGGTMFASRGDDALAPASNMKLLTSAAAMSMLGADYEFVTRVVARGPVRDGAVQGDLCIIGAGDANISGRFHDGEPLALFKLWAGALKNHGINRIAGDIQFDSSLYGDPAYNESWPKDDQYTKWYCAEVSALAFNDNCVGIKVTPTRAGQPAKIETIPPTAYVKVVNETTTVAGRKGAEIGILRPRDGNTITVKGKVYEQSTWGYTVDVAVHNPAAYAATVLKESLEAAGITVTGSIKSVALSADEKSSASTLIEHRSRLVEALKPINTNSQNLHAEMLLRHLGAQASGKGTFAGGTEAIKAFLKQEGIPSDGSVLIDGSGLAADNRISARLLASLLRKVAGKAWYGTFRDSLATGGSGTLEKRLGEAKLRGKVFAKTGYINGVRALSGYLIGDKRKVAFSILMTDCVYSRECQDEIVKLLAGA